MTTPSKFVPFPNFITFEEANSELARLAKSIETGSSEIETSADLEAARWLFGKRKESIIAFLGLIQSYLNDGDLVDNSGVSK
jgi:hypothetical protein